MGPEGAQLAAGGTNTTQITTETDMPFSSHPSQDAYTTGDHADESMLVMTANNLTMATKKTRSK